MDCSHTNAILESISDGVFTVDEEWRITSFNRAAEEITGVPRREAMGRLCSEVLRADMCGDACALRKTVKTGKAIIGKTGYIIAADGERVPVSVSTSVLYDASGNRIGGAETFRDQSETEALRLELEGKKRIGDMASNNLSMLDIFKTLPAIASSPSTVLIQGETGTGKELLARTIHELGPRGRGPFVAVNCGALPDSLLESELFGYKSGAFTGAIRDKPGRFALAQGGTLFLDEIGEVTPALQVKLLRVLQEKVYDPLGGITSEKADARIIAATNKNLVEQIDKGLFRDDLYYRLNVARVELPPLRKRKEDIPLLVDRFIARFNRLQNKTVTGVSSEAMILLMAYDWPGNIRELENSIERAFILCGSGRIMKGHLPRELCSLGDGTRPGGDKSLYAAQAEAERQAIQTALENNGFNRTAAARDLGIHKATLFRRMKRLGFPSTPLDGRSRISRA